MKFLLKLSHHCLSSEEKQSHLEDKKMHHRESSWVFVLVLNFYFYHVKEQIVAVFLLLFHCCVWFFAVPRTAACQASLSITNSRSLLKLMSIDLVMPSNHLYPLSSPSHPAFNPFQHQGLFQWVGSSRQVAKGLERQPQHQSFQWIFRVDFL